LGVLVGFAGVEHGILEVMQGNTPTDGLMIDAIGPAHKLWEHGGELAFSVVPNFLATGILAIVLGLLVTIWALRFVHTRSGALVLLGLTMALFLTGGGFAPILFSVLAVIAALKINSQLSWWRSVPRSLRRGLSALWPWPIAITCALFAIAVEIAIFGYPLRWMLDADATFAVQNALAYIMLALVVVSIPVAFARDISLRPEDTS
jgi:hypothetical protein